METWNNDNLPENHELIKNVQFIGVTENTWKRKNNDGKEEIAPKWDYMTSPDEQGFNMAISVYSSTDKEAIEMNKPYDLIVKRAIGKDGQFYGHSLKGFGEAGKPIPKKEPQSRWQKGQKLNAKAEALKATATIFQGKAVESPDEIISYAEILEAWIDGRYSVPADTPAEKK